MTIQRLIGKTVVLTKEIFAVDLTQDKKMTFSVGECFFVLDHSGNGTYVLEDQNGNHIPNVSYEYFEVVEPETKTKTKNMYLIRNSYIHQKACYWDGFDWVEADKAMYFLDEDAAQKIATSIYEFGKTLAQVIISNYDAVE